MASDHEVRAFAIISLHYLYIVCVALQEEDVRTSTVPPRITTTDPFTFRRYQSEQGKKLLFWGEGKLIFTPQTIRLTSATILTARRRRVPLTSLLQLLNRVSTKTPQLTN